MIEKGGSTMNFLNLIVFIVQIILAIRALRIFYKNPLDFSAIFILLYIVFYTPAYWDYFLKLNMFSNEFLNYFRITGSYSTVTKYNLISVGIMLAFELGYSLKRNVKRKVVAPYVMNSQNYYLLMNILFFVWLIITVIGFINYGGSIKLFFSPARKTIYSSGYLISLVVIIPTTLLTLKVIRDLEINKKKNITTFFFILILILTQMSLGQRREIINGVIYITLLLMYANLAKMKDIISNLRLKIARKKIVLLGIMVSVLVPTLWWGRTYSTQLQRGVTKVIMPWEIRGWFELLFGSSTTGFQTTLILDQFAKAYGDFWLHSIFFMLSIPIPRFIFPNKPMTITKTLQHTLGLEGNLSLFYINDMFFNFGIFCFIVSFLFGLALSHYYNSRLKSNLLIGKIGALILLAQITLLFKNGFAQYLIMILQYSIVINLALKFVTKRRKVSKLN